MVSDYVELYCHRERQVAEISCLTKILPVFIVLPLMKPYPGRDCVVMTCRGLFSNCLMSLCIRSKGWGNLWPRAGYLTLLKISWTFLCVGSEIFFMEMWYRDSPGLQDWLILQLNLRHSSSDMIWDVKYVLQRPESSQDGVTLYFKLRDWRRSRQVTHFGLKAIREN